MTPNEMRRELAQVYKGPMWRQKVADMDERQVIAVYLGMKREGRLFIHDREKERQKLCEAAPLPSLNEPEQISVWDLPEGKDL